MKSWSDLQTTDVPGARIDKRACKIEKVGEVGHGRGLVRFQCDVNHCFLKSMQSCRPPWQPTCLSSKEDLNQQPIHAMLSIFALLVAEVPLATTVGFSCALGSGVTGEDRPRRG